MFNQYPIILHMKEFLLKKDTETTGCQGQLNYHVVIVLNLKHLSVTKAFPCHCNSVKCFRVLQPELLLGGVKKQIFQALGLGMRLPKYSLHIYISKPSHRPVVAYSMCELSKTGFWEGLATANFWGVDVCLFVWKTILYFGGVFCTDQRYTVQCVFSIWGCKVLIIFQYRSFFSFHLVYFLQRFTFVLVTCTVK